MKKNIVIEWKLISILNIVQFLYYMIFKKLYVGNFSAIKKYNKDENFDLSSGKYNTKVLVQTIACGLCGTDRKLLSFNFSFLSSIFLYSKQHRVKKKYLGHEAVGTVIATGKDVKNLSPGDTVIIDAVIRDKKKIIGEEYGGFCKYFIKDQTHLVKTSGKLSHKLSCLIEPLSTSFAMFKKIKDFKKDSKIIIVGSGIIGFGLYKILRLSNLKSDNITIWTENFAHKRILENEKINNIIYGKNIFESSSQILNTEIRSNFFNKMLVSGYDYVFDCSGDDEVIKILPKITNINGTIVLGGLNMKKVFIDPVDFWQKNLTLLSSHGYEDEYEGLNMKTMNYIEELLIAGKITFNESYIEEINHVSWQKLFKSKKNNPIIKKVLKFT